MKEDEVINQGDMAPDFTLQATGGQSISLAQYKGKQIVLYFYPRDNTAGCSDEARGFSEMYQAIAAADGIVLGISRDAVTTHEKFQVKLGLPFPLLSDPDGVVCNLYGVLKEKNMYGKKALGIERSTFVINREGIVSHIFRKVKVAGHAQAVVEILQQK